MVKEEIWSVSLDRARKFFREQENVTESKDGFAYGSCRIQLTELKPKGMGIWAAKRINIRMEGEEKDISAIYHRFFIQFLSAGG